MEVQVTTWEKEGNGEGATATTRSFSSQREFEDAGYNDRVWVSFKRGMNNDWDEDAILKIPEWLADDKGLPFLGGGNSYHSDSKWTDFTAVNLDDENETELALCVNAYRVSDTGLLSNTNGLRRRNKRMYLPKSQVVMFTLEEPKQGFENCWACGFPMLARDSIVGDTSRVVFEYNGETKDEMLCQNCSKKYADFNQDGTNRERKNECEECGTKDITCLEFMTPSDGNGWRCSDCIPERVKEFREVHREINSIP